MESMTWKFEDKIAWGAGPWLSDDLDKAQWEDHNTGMPCLAVRGMTTGR